MNATIIKRFKDIAPKILEKDFKYDGYSHTQLAELAHDFLEEFQTQKLWNIDSEEKFSYEMNKIINLRSLVKDYIHNPNIPLFNTIPNIFGNNLNEPSGSLHGIGFIFDEDKDDRILLAIDQLVKHKNRKLAKEVIAVYEHEGKIVLFSLSFLNIIGFGVCLDEWCVEEFVLHNNSWNYVDNSEDCKGLYIGPVTNPDWKSEPPTYKQVSFLHRFGHFNDIPPKTKLEASLLIDKYQKQKTQIMERAR